MLFVLYLSACLHDTLCLLCFTRGKDLEVALNVYSVHFAHFKNDCSFHDLHSRGAMVGKNYDDDAY